MAIDIKIKHIVAAVGFGDWTHSVLKTAAEVGWKYGARLTVIYAEQFTPPVYFATQRARADLDARRDAAKSHLDEVVRTAIGDQVEAETCVVEQPPVEAIVNTVDRVNADLLVMGPHKRRGIKRFMLGAVSEAAFRWINIPILTVRGTGPEASGEYQKILCPVNFKPVSLEALFYAADLAARCEAELEVISCLESDDESPKVLNAYEQRLDEWVPEEIQARCTLNTVVRQGEATEEILTVAREGKHDLIVLGAQHRPLLEATIYGTTSIRTMRYAPCPVLTVTRC